MSRNGTDSPPRQELAQRCAFCDRTKDDVRILVAKPTVAICDDCVGACVDTINEELMKEIANDAAPQPTLSNRDPGCCRLCSVPTNGVFGVSVDGVAVLCPQCLQRVLEAVERKGVRQ